MRETNALFEHDLIFLKFDVRKNNISYYTYTHTYMW